MRVSAIPGKTLIFEPRKYYFPDIHSFTSSQPSIRTFPHPVNPVHPVNSGFPIARLVLR
jgi:hypothetical protein